MLSFFYTGTVIFTARSYECWINKGVVGLVSFYPLYYTEGKDVATAFVGWL